MPIANKHIVVTRATHQADEFISLLLEQMAIPILYPCIAIVPPDDTTLIDNTLNKLETFDWVIFTSSNTVHAIDNRLQNMTLHPDWSMIKIAVVGHKTAQAVKDLLHCVPDFTPSVYIAEALGDTLPDVDGKKILIPQSALADNHLSQILTRRGADVTYINAYQTILGQGGDDVPALLRQNKIDMLTFTSSSTVKNFVKRIHPLAIPHLPVVCIGSSTAMTARKIGFRDVVFPEKYSLKGMVQVMQMYS